ncbi:hypothetical protein ACF1FX_36105 [Streptomyces sp. NPDC014646]|uniref:hypothetical protein n=1 Tax=unclassified Streptomyces TaxID=2593676 RepID=UPI00370103B9
MGGDELAHRFDQVHAQVVPYEHDRAAELDVRSDLSDADRIAALRAALQQVMPVLAYCADREAADDPKHAAVVIAAADEAAQALARTA